MTQTYHKEEEFMSEERPVAVRVRRTPLAMLSDASMAIEHFRVAATVREKHLEKRGQSCPDTQELILRSMDLEDWVNGRLAGYMEPHPAYWWFSHIKGIGKENIAKVIGEIEGFGRFYPVGDSWIPAYVHRLPESYYKLDGSKLVEETGVWVEGIERCTTPSKLRVHAGWAPGIKRRVGETLRYNARLKMLVWRLAVSLMRVKGYSWVADPSLLGYSGDVDKLASKDGKGKTLYHVPDPARNGKFYSFYCEYHDYLVRREVAKGTNIIPTPKARFCAACQKDVVKKAAKFCPDCHGPLSLKTEPPGYLYEGHLHNMVMRRTGQLFLDLLWVAWREGLGLPLRTPYSVEYGGHSRIITCQDMMD